MWSSTALNNWWISWINDRKTLHTMQILTTPNQNLPAKHRSDKIPQLTPRTMIITIRWIWIELYVLFVTLSIKNDSIANEWLNLIFCSLYFPLCRTILQIWYVKLCSNYVQYENGSNGLFLRMATKMEKIFHLSKLYIITCTNNNSLIQIEKADSRWEKNIQEVQ